MLGRKRMDRATKRKIKACAQQAVELFPGDSWDKRRRDPRFLAIGELEKATPKYVGTLINCDAYIKSAKEVADETILHLKIYGSPDGSPGVFARYPGMLPFVANDFVSIVGRVSGVSTQDVKFAETGAYRVMPAIQVIYVVDFFELNLRKIK